MSVARYSNIPEFQRAMGYARLRAKVQHITLFVRFYVYVTSAGDVHSNPHSQIPVNSHFNVISCTNQRPENIYEISIFPSLLHAWLI